MFESKKFGLESIFGQKNFGVLETPALHSMANLYLIFPTKNSKCKFGKCVSYTENHVLYTVFCVAYTAHFRGSWGDYKIRCSNYKPKFKPVLALQNLKSVFQNSIPLYIFRLSQFIQAKALHRFPCKLHGNQIRVKVFGNKIFGQNDYCV